MLRRWSDSVGVQRGIALWIRRRHGRGSDDCGGLQNKNDTGANIRDQLSENRLLGELLDVWCAQDEDEDTPG